jgi:PEGA domain
MKRVLVILIFVSAVYMFGSQFQILQEPAEVSMHAGFVNLPDKDRYDINGDLCGMLIVRTGIEEMNIDSPMRHRQINKPGEYWIVLSPGTSYVDLKKVDYATLMVDFRQSINRIEAGKVYEMTIDGDGGGEFLPVSIIADPSGAEKWLDGELLGTEDTYTVKKGEYLLEVKMPGYNTYSKTITVDAEYVLFKDIILEKQKPVLLTITSKPTGAELYLDGVKEGETDIQLFRYPDEYGLRLVLDKYETVENKVSVIENGNNNWHYELMKITSILSVDVTPSNADVFINNKKLNGVSKEVSAGQYLIEVSCDGWHTESRMITIEKNKDQKVKFDLKEQTGSLQVTINPIKALCILEMNGKKLESWKGSKYFEELSVGEYDLSVSAKGYKNESNRKIIIKESKLTNEEVTLKKESKKKQKINTGITNNDNEIRYPDWWNVQGDPNYIHTFGVGLKVSRNIGADAGRANAMLNAAQYVESELQELIKNLEEEIGYENPVTHALTTKIVKEVANSKFTNTMITKQSISLIDTEGGERYKVFTRVSIPRETVNKILANKIKYEEALYNEFKASRIFQELLRETEE